MTTYHQLSALSRLLASLRPVSVLQDPEPTLPPPRIPLAEGNGGIRYKDISDPAVPVQALITAYPQFLENDTIELFWNGRLADSRLVERVHIDQGSITLNIPSIAIQDGTPPVHYLTTSAIGGNTRKSFPLEIRVKTTVPGGVDPVPSTPTVNENLLVVSGVPEVVDATNVDNIIATVPRYPNMHEDDNITLSWGGHFVTHKLESIEVNHPVDLPVPAETIKAAGVGPVVIEYEVRDIVNNWSLWSQQFNVEVEVGDDLLREPDALDAPDGQLDLDKLGDNDTQLRVRVYPEMDFDDQLTLFWTATPPDGTPFTHTEAGEVEEEGLPVLFTVPNAIVKASAGGAVAVKYTVVSPRGEQHSRRTRFEVIGQAQGFPAPCVEQAVGDELDPERLPNSGATVVVKPYPGMDSGDKVWLYIRGTDADGNPSSAQYDEDISDGEVGYDVTFYVPKAFIAPLLDGTLRLEYRVKGNVSDALVLRIVNAGGAELTAPTVNGVDDGVLDPDTVPSGTLAVVPKKYQGKVLDDNITLSWTGLPNASFSDSIKVTTENIDTEIKFNVLPRYITGNLNTPVSVSYQVARANGGTANSAPLAFRVQRQAGEDFVAPTVTQAPGGNLDPINALEGATVRVSYDGMQTTDTLAVAWTGTNAADTIETDPKPGSASGYVDFPIPISVVAASQGKAITVQYAVTRNGQPAKPSKVLNLTVGKLAQTALPKPQVPQAKDGVLDLATFSGDATITVVPWKLMAINQRYWIVVSGTLANGTAYSFYAARAVQVQASELSAGLNVPALRNELEKFAHANPLTVTAKVSFDHAPEESAAINFPAESLILKNHKDTLDFSEFAVGKLTGGQQYDFGFGYLVCSRENPNEIRNGKIPPFIDGNYLYAKKGTSAVCVLRLSKPYRRIRINNGGAMNLTLGNLDSQPFESPQIIELPAPGNSVYLSIETYLDLEVLVGEITVYY
ncbi:hypothetical protein [Pseudomonas sp. H9]|uniref:hypothetical protein n=1 Tax=Pseudomonas sp. H9 TaxID=483968 RepID=UPI001057940A|nr:hypothetical protein [Pseudomonas sp. H9]TDF84351.1 hypothetical protein E1573_07425 [Pseudomonas sp. H9]